MTGNYVGRLLTVIFAVEVNAVLFNLLVERSSCSTSENFDLGSTFVDDNFELDKRLAKQQNYSFLDILQISNMLFVLLVYKYSSAKDASARKSPSWLGIAVAFWIWVVVTVGRLRPSGVFGCASGDSECCGNMKLSVVDEKILLPSCKVPLDGYIRENFCPIPPWYNIDNCPSGFSSTFDMSLYYTYGCSAKWTPVPYFVNRALICNEFLFAIVMLLFKV